MGQKMASGSHRRTLLGCLAALAAGSGCASTTYQIAYSRELKRLFEAADVPVPLDKVKERCSGERVSTLRTTADTPVPCNPCLEEATCDDKHCLYNVVKPSSVSSQGHTSLDRPGYEVTTNFIDIVATE